jgi:hypothetical protein
MVVSEPPTAESQSGVTKDADTQPAPRRTSVRQIEANRKNALHSTGPTTPEGKQASRLNALKSGLRAKEMIIPGQEDPAELEAILRELYEEREPKGHTEHQLVEQIGLGEWKLRRLLRAELGEIRKQMASRTANPASTVEEEIQRAFKYLPWRLPRILGKSTAGIAYLRKAVKVAIDELVSKGQVCIEDLERVFGTESDSPAATLRSARLKALFAKEMPGENEKDFDNDGKLTPKAAARMNAATHNHLQMTLKDLDRQQRKLRKQEKIDLEIVRQRLSIVQGPELERFQRYETSIKRGMYRDIDLLERLQRRRRGEPQPPSVNVNVSSDDSD